MTASTERRLVIDTDVTSFLFAGRDIGSIMQRAIAGADLNISAVTVGEILKGAYAANWGVRRVATLLRFIDRRFHVIQVDEPVAARWAELMSACMSHGYTPGTNDAWIAATAAAAKCPLVSRDAGFREIARHYPRLDVIA